MDAWRDDAGSFSKPDGLPVAVLADDNVLVHFMKERQYQRDVAAVRVREIAAEIVDAARQGAITMATSPHRRREYSICPQSWWVQGNWDHLLMRSELDPSAPQNEYSSRRGQLLFVGRRGVELLLQGHLPSASETGSNAGRNLGGRSNILPTMLSIYRERVKEKNCLKMKKAEANAIILEWTGDVPCPDTATVERRLTEFHRCLHFKDGRLTDESAAQVLAQIDSKIAEFPVV